MSKAATKAPVKAFASQADLTEKKITFEQLSEHCWAYTAEGDPNSGVIIGDRFIMVSDATATPAMAQDLIKKIRTVSDLPIKYVLLTHYHAVRVLGAYAYAAEGATEIIASEGTLDLIKERGAQDMKSEMERFPRLFRGADSIPGLTWPTMVVGGGNPTKGEVPGKLSINLGGVVVQIWHPGPGHTRGDTIAWVEEEKVLFSGDLGRVRSRCLHGRRPTARVARHARSTACTERRIHRAGPRRSHEGQRQREQSLGLHPALGHHLVPSGQRSRGRQDGPQSRHGPHPQEHGPCVWPCVHLRALLAV